MKKIMIVLVAMSLTIGGCMRPMNTANRPPREQHAHLRPAPPVDQPGPDRRPSSY